MDVEAVDDYAGRATLRVRDAAGGVVTATVGPTLYRLYLPIAGSNWR